MYQIRKSCQPVLILLLLGTGWNLGAQVKRNQDNEEYKIARQYEAIGELEQALKIYHRLLQKNTKNITYFDAVSRCYINLGRNDELITLLEAKIAEEPVNLQYQIRLGEAYLRSEDENRAFQIWDDLLNKNRTNITVYRMVANALVRGRHFDRAIEIYVRGRETIEKSQLFSLELAQLHTYRFNYDLATDEYLRYLVTSPKQLSYVESQIASFKGTNETYNQVTSVIKKWIGRESQNQVFRKLLISFLLNYENYDDAFSEVKHLEKLKSELDDSDPGGLELFKFSQVAAIENQFEFSEKALREIIRDYPDYPDRGRVEYELGRTLDLQGQYPKALDAFRSVVRKYPGSNWAVESTLSIGDIFLFKSFQPDSAARNYKKVLDNFPRSDGYVDALIRLGDVLLARGSLADAEPLYIKAIDQKAKNGPRVDDRTFEGMFKLAELSFFQKDFEKCRKYLGQILDSKPGMFSNPFVNDALELSLLLDRNKETTQALNKYADAQLLNRQHKYEEAALEFLELAESFPSSNLAPQSRYSYAEMKQKTGDFLASVYGYQNLVGQFPNHSLCDLALWQVGTIYETDLKDPAKAIDSYESILVNYPGSMLVENARRKIRSLEGRP